MFDNRNIRLIDPATPATETRYLVTFLGQTVADCPTREGAEKWAAAAANRYPAHTVPAPPVITTYQR